MSNFSLSTIKNNSSLTKANGNSLANLKKNVGSNMPSVTSRMNSLTAQVISQVPALIQEMKENSTELLFILDCSSSCFGTEEDTILGYNQLINKERKSEYPTKVTTVLFNHKQKVVCNRADISNVGGLEYHTDGCTALYDTLCSQILSVRSQQAKDKNPPKRKLCVIMTDGEDTASKTYDLNRTRSLIRESQAAGWEFIFLATNIDAYQTAAHLGIDFKNAANYKVENHGILFNFEAVGKALDDMRKTGPISVDWSKNIKNNTLAIEQQEKHDRPKYCLKGNR